MTTRKKQSGTDVSAPSGLESRIEMLFETSWEVCNKVGGIYAVLSTKAKVLGQKFGDKLVFIGPDIWTEETPSPHFKERKTRVAMEFETAIKGANCSFYIPI